MLTRRKPGRPRTQTRQLVSRAMYADEAYWLGLAAKMLGVSMHELVSRHMREPIRKVLTKAGIDPDARWSDVGGN